MRALVTLLKGLPLHAQASNHVARRHFSWFVEAHYCTQKKNFWLFYIFLTILFFFWPFFLFLTILSFSDHFIFFWPSYLFLTILSFFWPFYLFSDHFIFFWPFFFFLTILFLSFFWLFYLFSNHFIFFLTILSFFWPFYLFSDHFIFFVTILSFFWLFYLFSDHLIFLPFFNWFDIKRNYVWCHQINRKMVITIQIWSNKIQKRFLCVQVAPSETPRT